MNNRKKGWSGRGDAFGVQRFGLGSFSKKKIVLLVLHYTLLIPD
jgi:hypothetical protein